MYIFLGSYTYILYRLKYVCMCAHIDRDNERGQRYRETGIVNLSLDDLNRRFDVLPMSSEIWSYLARMAIEVGQLSGSYSGT